MSDDRNLFDEDDALDYIIYKEVTKEDAESTPDNQAKEGKGCFGMVLLLILPFATFWYFI